MNKPPKTLSKMVMGIAATCCFTTEVVACGPSFGPVGTAILIGVLALAVLVPTVLAAAGTIAAFRIHGAGLTLRDISILTAAVLCELGAIRLVGAGSFVGMMALGVGALQLALVAMTALNGPDRGPLPGRVTVLSTQALGLNF